jgi:hypothetical protein
MSKKATPASAALGVAAIIEAGLDAKKCRRCGKMAGVIDRAAKAFAASEDPEVKSVADKVVALRNRKLKEASVDFGCGGCWGSKARRALSKALKTSKSPDGSKAEAKPKSMRFDRKGSFEIAVEGGLIRCVYRKRKGEAVVVASGHDAASIVAAVGEAGLIKRIETAAYLGWELARAEVALGSGEPYSPAPW